MLKVPYIPDCFFFSTSNSSELFSRDFIARIFRSLLKATLWTKPLPVVFKIGCTDSRHQAGSCISSLCDITKGWCLALCVEAQGFWAVERAEDAVDLGRVFEVHAAADTLLENKRNYSYNDLPYMGPFQTPACVYVWQRTCVLCILPTCSQFRVLFVYFIQFLLMMGLLPCTWFSLLPPFIALLDTTIDINAFLFYTYMLLIMPFFIYYFCLQWQYWQIWFFFIFFLLLLCTCYADLHNLFIGKGLY